MASTVTSHRRPALRPLACALGLVLATSAITSLQAAVLDGQHATIEHDHSVEDWRLINGATLAVNRASLYTLDVNNDSRATLHHADVQRIATTMNAYSTMVLDGGRLDATGTRFRHGGIWVAGASRAELTDSAVIVDGTAPGMQDNRLTAWGFSLNNNNPGADGVPAAVLDNTTVTIADRADRSHYSSGIGAYMAAGELTLRNGSRINAANVGVVMHGYKSENHALTVNLDNAHIDAGRGSGIEIASSDGASNTYVITVTNGSTIDAGDGNLLRVRGHGDVPTMGTNTVQFVVDNSWLEGNVTVDPTSVQATVNMELRDNARLTGRLSNVSRAMIGGDSRWTLTGDSTVEHVTLFSDGRIELGDGGTFNTLTLDSFLGADGTLVFNTALEGDTSLTDKLVIQGDAEGQANVIVRNAGGNGAQTEHGIELIDIDGRSDAHFTLLGRAAGGLYDYFLLKGDDGSWYLRSELQPDPPHECELDPQLPQCEVTLPVEPGDPTDPTDPTDPIDPTDPTDPEEPGQPTPVLRPEIGAYLANQAAARQLLDHSARERMQGAAATDGLRTWAGTSHTEARMDITGKQHLASHQSRLQVGADMGAFDGGNGRVGALLSAGQANATTRSRVTGYRADATVEGGAAGVYAHWTDDATLLDASVQVGRFSNRVAGEGLQLERYTTSALQASVEAAHRFSVGRIGGLALSVQPEVRLTYTRVRMDEHRESNGTVIAQADGGGLSTRVGLRLEGDAAMAAGRFQPYLSVHGYHDGSRNRLLFDGAAVDGAQPRHRVELSAGAQLQFGAGFSGAAALSGGHGSEGYRDLGARIGLQYRW